MVRHRLMIGAAAIVAALVVLPSLATANVLLNASFENYYEGGGPKPTDWIAFSNTYDEAMSFAHTGARLEKFFGDWSSPWNASGVLQIYPAAAGDLWEIGCFAYHWSGDPLNPDADPNLNNRLIMKIEFRDSGGIAIGSNEAVIVDPTTPKDVWIQPPSVQALAPAGTAQAVAVFVFLQPNYMGGSAWIDDATFDVVPEPASLALLGLALLLRRR